MMSQQLQPFLSRALAFDAPFGRLRLRTVLRSILTACLVTVLTTASSDASPRPEPKRPLIFVPGLLGSRLCRPSQKNPNEPVLVWGSLSALSQFLSLRLDPDGAKDETTPCGLLREVVFFGGFAQDVYAPVIAHLEQIGYAEGRNLFVFAYDWRRSVFENAERLAAFVSEKVPDPAQPPP